MMSLKAITSNKNQIISAYFGIALIGIVAELFEFNTVLMVSQIAWPLLLLLIYYRISRKRSNLFYAVIVLIILSNIFFYFQHSMNLIGSTLMFVLQRIVALILIFKLIPVKNYLLISLASFPFLVMFFYLISATIEISDFEFNMLVIESILISILSGIAIVSYFTNENRANSWFLISTLLFIGLQFIVFIERFFLSDIRIEIYRPIEVLLNVFAFFTFYKFVIAAEINYGNFKNETDNETVR